MAVGFGEALAGDVGRRAVHRARTAPFALSWFSGRRRRARADGSHAERSRVSMCGRTSEEHCPGRTGCRSTMDVELAWASAPAAMPPEIGELMLELHVLEVARVGLGPTTIVPQHARSSSRCAFSNRGHLCCAALRARLEGRHARYALDPRRCRRTWVSMGALLAVCRDP